MAARAAFAFQFMHVHIEVDGWRRDVVLGDVLGNVVLAEMSGSSLHSCPVKSPVLNSEFIVWKS